MTTVIFYKPAPSCQSRLIQKRKKGIQAPPHRIGQRLFLAAEAPFTRGSGQNGHNERGEVAGSDGVGPLSRLFLAQRCFENFKHAPVDFRFGARNRTVVIFMSEFRRKQFRLRKQSLKRLVDCEIERVRQVVDFDLRRGQ